MRIIKYILHIKWIKNLSISKKLNLLIAMSGTLVIVQICSISFLEKNLPSALILASISIITVTGLLGLFLIAYINKGMLTHIYEIARISQKKLYKTLIRAQSDMGEGVTIMESDKIIY